MSSLRELLYADEWAGSPHADAAVNEPFERVFYTRSRKLGHIFYRRFDGYFIRELADATQNHIAAVLAAAYRPAEEDLHEQL